MANVLSNYSMRRLGTPTGKTESAPRAATLRPRRYPMDLNAQFNASRTFITNPVYVTQSYACKAAAM